MTRPPFRNIWFYRHNRDYNTTNLDVSDISPWLLDSNMLMVTETGINNQNFLFICKNLKLLAASDILI